LTLIRISRGGAVAAEFDEGEAQEARPPAKATRVKYDTNDARRPGDTEVRKRLKNREIIYKIDNLVAMIDWFYKITRKIL